MAIIAARRTPIGTAGHALATLTAADLAAATLVAVVGDVTASGLSGAVSEVVLGNCLGPGGNLARVASLQAGLPTATASLTVDRQCASGLAAVDLGARLAAAAGSGSVVLAGGVESASTAPWRFWPPVDSEPPRRYVRAPFTSASWGDPDMGPAADLIAAEAGISRARQDAYAARSHARAYAATQSGAFAAELVPVAALTRDERPRTGLTPERLGRLRPAFATDGTATAGNSCGISDGAAVVALLPDAERKLRGLPGLRILACATSGVDPRRPGLGLVPAVRAALTDAGLAMADLDVIEINEAFAGQVLAGADRLGLAEERICPDGGAIALGHPWGASGAVLVVRLFSRLIRTDGGRYGLAAIAAGGGQGVAMVVQACQ